MKPIHETDPRRPQALSVSLLRSMADDLPESLAELGVSAKEAVALQDALLGDELS